MESHNDLICILLIYCNPNVHVTSCTRIAMVADSITTD